MRSLGPGHKCQFCKVLLFDNNKKKCIFSWPKMCFISTVSSPNWSVWLGNMFDIQKPRMDTKKASWCHRKRVSFICWQNVYAKLMHKYCHWHGTLMLISFPLLNLWNFDGGNKFKDKLRVYDESNYFQYYIQGLNLTKLLTLEQSCLYFTSFVKFEN